ncbi:MAG: cation:dicarboxylase symporter family transporter, partial [Candidatus Tectomicrobia bacterium]|nr:cation:dicarboxylase symporter family transporter [Candidatus Tectomicrobia bacterium]
GLAVGLFFGESVGFFKDIGKAFILLLQMTVLPYITLSLITGLGQLTYQEVKGLILKAGAILVFSWGLAIAAVLVIPLAFPVRESASFFSTSLVEQSELVNYLQLFIPSNPFYSFANNIVPAVVLFSIALGLGLIGVQEKHGLLDHLRILNRAAAFLVKDHRRDAFNRRDAIQRLEAPRVGVLNVPYYVDKLQRYLPQAEMVTLTSVREFLEHQGDDLDAFLYTAEAGSAWSLLYPAYTVAIPQPDVLTGPLAYATVRDNSQLIDFMNVWIELKKQDRTIASLYDYWILGKNAMPKQPRWSVIRNVFHWVE